MSTTPLSAAQLTKIRARCAAATAGPWMKDPPWGLPWEVGAHSMTDRGVTVARTLGDAAPQNCPQENSEQAIHDATFIAAARADVPRLLDEVDRLRSALLGIAILTQSQTAARLAREALDGEPQA